MNATFEDVVAEIRAMAAKLDAMKGGPQVTQNYEFRELTVNELDGPADGTYIQRDGSQWATDSTTGAKFQIVYGYISKVKDPVMWAHMARIMGSEERLKSALHASPWARYKVNPNAVIHSGSPTLNLLSMQLAGAIPPSPVPAS